VIDDFVRNYLAGRTPNPCVLCNTAVKWRFLRAKARALGFECLATGHYARVGAHPDGTFSLFTGIDTAKDQSYFLWGLTSGDLAATLFPLGGLTKAETRAEARKRNLPTAERAESQEICFITDNDYGRFLQHRLGGELPLPLTPGKILDASGAVIGEHRGAAHYTIGQRKGLGIALGRPAYVTHIDAVSNTITVGGKEDLLAGAMTVAGITWTRGFPPEPEFRCTTRIRYRHPGVSSLVRIIPEGARVSFDIPQSAVTSGQSAVFYDGERVLGGGIIEKPER
ncbi:MAG TPA: tRNA 2-thiouridine(34) synthase MnmA, partial [Armatimonadota bacterium]|nr:tRNA 2-thiouridine(34) synthase MnmA [Armatimonadota bacterium]